MEAGILLKRPRRERRSRGDKPQHALQGLDAMMVIAVIVMVILPIVATPVAISALGRRRQARDGVVRGQRLSASVATWRYRGATRQSWFG